MKKLLTIAFVASLLTVNALATTVPACDATKHDESGFTECEGLKIRYLQRLKLPYLMKAQEIDSQIEQFVQSISQNYPGKTYEPPSRNFPAGRIIDPPAAPAKK